jgi:hypothetical protein
MAKSRTVADVVVEAAYFSLVAGTITFGLLLTTIHP